MFGGLGDRYFEETFEVHIQHALEICQSIPNYWKISGVWYSHPSVSSDQMEFD